MLLAKLFILCISLQLPIFEAMIFQAAFEFSTWRAQCYH